MLDSRDNHIGNEILNEAIDLLNSRYDYVTLVAALDLTDLKETIWLLNGYLENRELLLPFTIPNFNLLVEMAYHHLEDRIKQYER